MQRVDGSTIIPALAAAAADGEPGGERVAIGSIARSLDRAETRQPLATLLHTPSSCRIRYAARPAAPAARLGCVLRMHRTGGAVTVLTSSGSFLEKMRHDFQCEIRNSYYSTCTRSTSIHTVQL